MARLLVYYAHPGHRFSNVNRAMFREAQQVSDITVVDLYAEYPRFDINIDLEQSRLVDHDVILFQHPFFWYSTPALIKEWLDLVLEHGFAFGSGGDALKDKVLMQALSTAGPKEAYSAEGYQNHEIRSFLTPMEQTATLCKMRYTAPYVLFSALTAPTSGDLPEHVAHYRLLLEAIRDDRYDFDRAAESDVICAHNLPLHQDA